MLQKEHLIYYKVGLKNLKRNKMKNKHILPKMEESKQETQEEAAKEFVLSHDFSRLTNPNHLANRCFQYGAKWQQEQDSWKSVSEETPPTSVELLVKSPNGVIYLSSWRESYQIFCCQDKSESSSDWKWKTI